jgi:hypothetical protein
MLGKFVSVVHRQRMDLTFDLTQCPYEYVSDVIRMLREDRLNAGEASFSVHQGQQAPTAVPAHHEIDFPITDASFFIDDSGTVINRNPVGNRAFIRGFGRNLLRFFLLAQVGMKSATTVSIPADMLVDPLMGYRECFVSSEPAGNLLGAPLVTQFAFDQTATASGPLEGTTTVCPSFLAALVSGLRKISVGASISF